MAEWRARYSLSAAQLGLLSGVIGWKIADLERDQRVLGESEGREKLIADLRVLKDKITAPIERLRARVSGGVCNG